MTRGTHSPWNGTITMRALCGSTCFTSMRLMPQLKW